LFNTGGVPRICCLRRRPEAAAARTVLPAASAALENDPAKVLQMVEAGEGLCADELSGRDRAGQVAWGAWFDYEAQVRQCKDTVAPSPEAERRYVDTSRAAFDVPPGLCERPANDRPSTTFPVEAPGRRPGRR
jgi:hypothetical protein